jgi:two-component system NarL family sensor kinase
MAYGWGPWLGSWLADASAITMAPVLLLLPNGRLPSRRWRSVLWLATLSAVLAVVVDAVLPGPLRTAPSIVNPLGITAAAGVIGVLDPVAQAAIRLGLLLSAISVIFRLRRARGEERQQLKWVMYGAIVWATAFAITFVIPRTWGAFAGAMYLLALNIFVASLGFAILKYRLYQIDLVIFRTLVYGMLAAFIAAVYIAIALVIGAALGSLGEPNLAVSLAATAVVAFAFQPVRERA